MKTKTANSILCLTLFVVALTTSILLITPAAAETAPGYGVVRTMVLGGDGGWDYIYRRLCGASRLHRARHPLYGG